jgi:hypothetical protein
MCGTERILRARTRGKGSIAIRFDGSSYRRGDEDPFQIELVQRPRENLNLPLPGVFAIDEYHGLAFNLAKPASTADSRIREVLVSEVHSQSERNLLEVFKKRRVVHAADPQYVIPGNEGLIRPEPLVKGKSSLGLAGGILPLIREFARMREFLLTIQRSIYNILQSFGVVSSP